MFRLEYVKYKNILDVDNLEIQGDKITCIVGESGSGKTTLLRLLNKLISPDKGKIYFMGRTLKEWDTIELRRKVTMLPQNPIMFNGNIRDNLLIGLKLSEKPLVKDEKLKEILELVNLNKVLDEPTQNLSGGEKQRLAIGRILLLDSDVYLLDEPTSALDEGTEVKVMNSVVEYIKSKNKTLIVVTHSKRIASSFGERVVEIFDGKVKI